MKNKGMNKIKRIFSTLNRVNIALNSAIKFNVKQEVKELAKVTKIEAQLLKAKLKSEAKTAVSLAAQRMLQDASSKAEVLLSNLTKLMSDEIAVTETDKADNGN